MIKAYNFSALGQSLLDILIKVGSFALVLLLNYVSAGLTNGTLQLPGGVAGLAIAAALALLVSQVDSKFVAWAQKNNITVPTQ